MSQPKPNPSVRHDPTRGALQTNRPIGKPVCNHSRGFPQRPLLSQKLHIGNGAGNEKFQLKTDKEPLGTITNMRSKMARAIAEEANNKKNRKK